MPDVFTGKVISVVSGPTPRSEKVITVEKRWRDGVYLGETEKEPFESSWFEVVAVVDELFVAPKERVFKFPSVEEANKVAPGYEFSF